MIGSLLVGTAVAIAMVIFHVVGLVVLSQQLERLASSPPGRGPHALTWFLSTATLAILALHTVEAWFWAILYLAIGEFTTMEGALYFSAVTVTTLGYGDIVLSGQWRLLSTFEAMSGLLLFAVSAAYLMAILRGFFESNDARP